MSADDPTAIRNPLDRDTGPWHVLSANWRFSVCRMWALNALDRVPLSETAPADRCRKCWPTTTGEVAP